MSSRNTTSSFTWFVRAAALTVVLVTSPVNSFFVGRPQQTVVNNNNAFQSSQHQHSQSTNSLSQQDTKKATLNVASKLSHNRLQLKHSTTFLSFSGTNVVNDDPMDGKSQPPAGGVRLIIAGAPASGKGTQCELIKAQYGVVHLSTGDMLREAVRAQTNVGLLAKEYMDSGKLVPDDVMITIVSNHTR